MTLIIKLIFLFNIEKIIIIKKNSENYPLNGIYIIFCSTNIKLFFLII